MATDPNQACKVCDQPLGEHLKYFRAARDPHDELHQRWDYGKPLHCPSDGDASTSWPKITWREAFGYE